MKEYSQASKPCVIGVDLAKSIFHLHGVDPSGKPVIQKKLNRRQLTEMMGNMPPCLIAMEACGGAHDWARRWIGMGHDVRLIAPQFVKPYVKSNKNDAVDAAAICEAVQRPDMRFVAVKNIEQQDIQSIHRARSLAVSQRTAQANQIRGLLLEYGFVIAQGVAAIRLALPEALDNTNNGLTPLFRNLLRTLWEDLQRHDQRIAAYDRQIRQLAEQSNACQRLMTIPGVGPLVSTALVAAVADGKSFNSGREMAAWLGLVPRQHATGGKPRLLGISKRGDSYLRMLVIHGARAALRWATKKSDQRSRWACDVARRRGQNVATVALAKKLFAQPGHYWFGVKNTKLSHHSGSKTQQQNCVDRTSDGKTSNTGTVESLAGTEVKRPLN